MEIRDWLEELGLGHHAESFAENEVGPDLLAELTNEDLTDLGVVKLGERKTILKAIADGALAAKVKDREIPEGLPGPGKRIGQFHPRHRIS